jgi:hypothetical protein
MPAKLLQRLEVWLLLLLAAGVAIWVLLPKASESDLQPPEVIPPDSPSQAGIIIHRTTLERDFGNARLDVELRYRNANPRTFILQPPDVRLVTGAGKEVPPFILPMEKPPQVPPSTAQDVRLRYWLEKADLQGPLTLDIRGEKAAVKGDTPLDLDSLENAKPKTWKGAIGS